MRSGRRRQRRISPLLAALKGNFEHRFLLLLGDPGSGKSVALRKLARDLLEEVPETGRIPVYLNLRDWVTPQQWSVSTPPRIDEIEANLREWVRQNLKERLDIYAGQFLDAHFDGLVKDGRLFFILDSFDEIALLLNVEERDPIVNCFSEAIGHFLGGMHNSRGILASRLFRRPTEQFDAPCHLEIRPLSDERFAQLARKRFLEVGITNRMMADRPDLAAAARNPFVAALLVQYLTSAARSSSPAVLPANRGEIFADYLSTRLAASREFLKRNDLSDDEMLSALEKLAEGMFHTHGSFDVALSGVPPLIASVDNAALLRALEQTRLVRIGQGLDPHVSFTHRRFAEYLAARNLLRNPYALTNHLVDIPTDSLWRDTLVLYCEIAPQEQAAAVASYCWSQMTALREIGKAEDASTWLRSLHCLRFLAESFRTHPEVILEFQNELHGYVLSKATEGDVLSAKWALEAAGLFRAEQSSQLLHAALKRGNPWLAETALRACRYLRVLDFHLHWRFLRVFLAKPYFELWTQRRDLDIALTANSAMRPVRLFFWTVVLDSWIWGAMILIAPVVACAVVAAGYDLSPSGTPFVGLWLGIFALYSVSAGLAPNWITLFFLPGYFVFIYRLLGPLMCLPGVSAGGIFGMTIFPFTFLPWSLLFSWQFYKERGWQTLVKSLTWKILLVAGGLAMALALMIGVAYSCRYCLRRANEVEDLSERFLWWLLPGSLAITIGATALYKVVRLIIYVIRDMRHLRLASIMPEAVTRHWINSVFEPLRLLFTRRVFVERLANVRKVTGEWPSGPPYKGNDWASAELARLDERWRGLDR